MPESKSSPEKGNRLPAVIPVTRTPSTQASKKTGILGALAVFAPLAIEVNYGLTRKLLAETTRKPVSGIEKEQFIKGKDSQPPGTAGFRRRYRGNQS